MPSQLAEELEPQVAPKRSRRTILIIEDDESMAEVLSVRLARQGYDSLRAHSGQKGLELARRHRPHLVLLDLRLPDLNGFHVCRQLDEDPQTSDIPVIVLSGMERPDIIRCSRAAGCSYYVRKPYDPNALLILIEHAIQETGD